MNSLDSHVRSHVRLILWNHAMVANEIGQPVFMQIGVMTLNKRHQRITCCEVPPNADIDGLANMVVTELATKLKRKFHFFVAPNARVESVTSHAPKDKIAPITFLLKVDIDRITPEELPERLGRLSVQSTQVVWSGHGAHLYFALSHAVSCGIAEKIEKRLAYMLDGDKNCWDRNRQLRLAGSMNWKDPSNPIPVVVMSSYSTGDVCDPDVFQMLLSQYGEDSDDTTTPTVAPDLVGIQQAIAQPVDETELRKWVGTLSPRIQSVIIEMFDPQHPGKNDRSALVQTAVTAMIGGEFTEQQIAQVMTCPSFLISERVLEENRNVRGAAGYLAECISKARIYIANHSTTKKTATKTAESGDAVQLAQAIAQSIKVCKDSGGDPHDVCAALVIESLKTDGRFFYCADGTYSFDIVAPRDRCYYQNAERQILGISDEQFDTMLRIDYGLPGIQGLHKSIRQFVVDRIAQRYHEYEAVEFCHVGQYRNHAFYMDQGRGKVLKITSSTMETIANGSDGVYFKTELREWTYKPEHVGGYLWDIFRLSVDPKAPYSEHEAILAVAFWVIANFMRGLVRHYALLNLIGDRGSGKTTLIENIVRVILGNAGYTSSGRPREERDFTAAVKDHGVAVFDNVEGFKYPWPFEDALARIYQQGTYQERKLYTNHTLIEFKTNTFVCLTAIRPGWGRTDVSDRSIVIELARWSDHKVQTESPQVHLDHLMSHRDDILTEVAKSLQALLQHMNAHDVNEYRIQHRLESYPMAVNAWAVANGVADLPQLQGFWSNLQSAQRDLTSVDTLTVELIERFVKDVLESDRGVFHSVRGRCLDNDSQPVGKVAIKPDNLYEYLIERFPTFRQEYSSNRHFKTAVAEQVEQLKEIGISIDLHARTNRSRFWAIDFSEYMFRHSADLGITSPLLYEDRCVKVSQDGTVVEIKFPSSTAVGE